MQRSQSMSLNIDEHLLKPSSPPLNKSPTRMNGSTIQRSVSMVAVDLLEENQERDHDHDNKKPTKFRPEQTVHLIPVVLILCGLVLWIGTPSETQIDLESVRSSSEVPVAIRAQKDEPGSSQLHDSPMRQQILRMSSTLTIDSKPSKEASNRRGIVRGVGNANMMIRGQ